MPGVTSLRERAISGVGWTTAAQVARQLLGLLVTAVLSRLLTPREFGLVAMIYVFTNFLNALRDMGLSSALVQRPELEHKHINAIFWVNCALGLGLTAIVAAFSPVVAWFYGEPALKSLALVSSLSFSIGSLGLAHRAVLSRNLLFSKVVTAELGAAIFGGIGACVLAWNGFGAWSLVAQSLLTAVVDTLVAWRLSRWRPTLSFESSALQGMVRYGANLAGFTSFNYWTRNLDNLLIGHYLGSIALGLYTRAYTLMLLPVTQTTQVLGRVMFATLSQVQTDTQRAKSIYLAATRVIALVAFPTMLGFFVVADHFIAILYGPGWEKVVPIFRVLCIAGVGQAVGSTVGWIYNSQGRTDLQFRWGVFSSIIMAASFVVGIRWGSLGVAWAYVVTGYVILWYPAWRIPFALISLTFTEMLANLAAIFLCALVMAAAVWCLRLYLPQDWAASLQLAILVSSGAALYVALCHFWRVRAWIEVCDIAKKRVRGRAAARQAQLDRKLRKD
jgi:O-antigen/teichoic acid export membrane protein